LGAPSGSFLFSISPEPQQRQYLCGAHTEAECKEWLQDLQDVITRKSPVLQGYLNKIGEVRKKLEEEVFRAFRRYVELF